MISKFFTCPKIFKSILHALQIKQIGTWKNCSMESRFFPVASSCSSNNTIANYCSKVTVVAVLQQRSCSSGGLVAMFLQQFTVATSLQQPSCSNLLQLRHYNSIPVAIYCSCVTVAAFLQQYPTYSFSTNLALGHKFGTMKRLICLLQQSQPFGRYFTTSVMQINGSGRSQRSM